MLDEMQKTISMAELAKNAEQIAKDIETASTVYRIRRPGHRPMVLMDQQQLESRIATAEFKARHPNWEQEIEEGRREYREGKCIPLDVVVEELGLAERPRKKSGSKAVGRATRPRRTKVVDALRVLAHAPHSGIALEIADFYMKVVIVRPRRWSYRLVYEICDRDLVLHDVDPPWRKRRAADLAPQ